MKPLTIRKDMLGKFSDLCCELSPENLTCDGELTPRQVKAKIGRIRTQWAELERKLGRKVTMQEVHTNLKRER